MRSTIFPCVLWLALVSICCAEAPHMATGVKVGEVTSSEAIVWGRLTARRERLWEGERKIGRAGKKSAEYKNPVDADKLHGAAPGTAGELRFLWGKGDQTLGSSPWTAVSEKTDYSHQFKMDQLTADTRHWVRVEGREAGGSSTPPTSRMARFRTAAAENKWQDVTFTVVTGQAYRDLDHKDGFHIYPAMGKLQPDFIVPTGDTVYYDSEKPRARTLQLARHHWHRMYSMPRLIEFHQQVPGYWEKDDHDTYNNDGWPGQSVPWMRPFTFKQGLATFREQVPMGKRTYRTFRWGKGLQIWLVEGRDFRSPNNGPDGPEKTIWGAEQFAWLKRTVRESNADFKVLISPTPIVGPDRAKKNDNHANKGFTHEGDLVRRWAAKEGLLVCCGDRHWQYMSVDPKTSLREFSCGPASNEHAGGTPGQDKEVQPFHRVKGGFLSVSVRKPMDTPTISFRFHGVHGKVAYEWKQARPAP